MTIRHVSRTVAVAAAIVCAGALATLASAGTAGAASSGDQIGSAVPTTTFTPGTPFSSGQTLEVKIPANAVLPQSQNIVIVECAAPNGVLPSLTSACDTNTVQGDTIQPNTDGSIDYHTFTIYALPDTFSLGESVSGTPKCGDTALTECVLFIGNNFNDFTAPHFWSQAFKVVPTQSDSGSNPGDGTPEAPLAIGLPIAGAGIVGGVLLVRRRRSMRSHAA